MKSDRDWQYSRNDSGWSLPDAGGGALRAALLFGAMAVAVSMLLTPVIDRAADKYVGARGEVDMIRTSSVEGRQTNYAIRRSVLQSSPNSLCIIQRNGTKNGDC